MQAFRVEGLWYAVPPCIKVWQTHSKPALEKRFFDPESLYSDLGLVAALIFAYTTDRIEEPRTRIPSSRISWGPAPATRRLKKRLGGLPSQNQAYIFKAGYHACG